MTLRRSTRALINANKTSRKWQGAAKKPAFQGTASNRKNQADYLRHSRKINGRKKAALMQIKEGRAIRRGEGP